MRRAVQSWALAGGLLGVAVVLADGGSGCAFREGMGENADPSASGNSSIGGGAGSSTTTTGTGETSGGGGSNPSDGGGEGGVVNPAVHIDEIEEMDEQQLGPSPLTAGEKGTRYIITGKFDSNNDSDKFVFNLAENYVVQFETIDPTTPPNDPHCDNLFTSLDLHDDDQSFADDYYVLEVDEELNLGVRKCAYASYYLNKKRNYDITISPRPNSGQQLAGKSYELRINVEPLKSEFDFDLGGVDGTTKLLTGWEADGTVAISGSSSISKPDVYKLSDAAGKAVRVEIIEGTLDHFYSCKQGDLLFTPELFDPDPSDSTKYDVDEGHGRQDCPMIDGLDTTKSGLDNNFAISLSANAHIRIAPMISDGNCSNCASIFLMPYTLLVTIR